MSDALKNRIGPYHYADGAAGNKGFGDRRFKVVISSAYNAGIIGPEHNGIVVLDDDNRTVVLDRHAIESSGYFGPSKRQKAEFERIMAMDWAAFSRFCREHERFRIHSASDFFNLVPQKFPFPEDRVIYPAEAKDNAEAELYPLDGRREIAAFLSGHSVHRLGGPHSNWALAWSVKAHGFDGSGKAAGTDTDRDKDFDDRWKEHVEDGDRAFRRACSAGLRRYLEGEHETYGGGDRGNYGFAVTGRSLGWLVLTKCGDLDPPNWSGRKDLSGYLEELDDRELLQLYKLVAGMDRETQPLAIKRELERQYALLRQEMEEEWRREAEFSV